jgi:hypothetical protein
MKKVKLFEEFINEAKSFEFSFDYNTDPDDVEYIQNILMDAGVDATAEPGTFDDEMIVKAPNAIELRKAKKAIQADGFEINESTQMPKPMKGLKYEKVKAKDLKIGDELSDGIQQTWEISKVVSTNPVKLEVVETIVPKDNPRYKAPGTPIGIEFGPSDSMFKIIR